MRGWAVLVVAELLAGGESKCNASVYAAYMSVGRNPSELSPALYLAVLNGLKHK